MPIITVQVIKGVVLTSDAQKRDLLKKMTDTFISVVGEVARPYTYCIIQETPVYEWSIGGQPLPDLPFLYGPEYAAMHAKANDIMRSFVASQSSGNGSSAQPAASAPAGHADVSATVTPAVGPSDVSDEQKHQAHHAQSIWEGKSHH